MSSNRLILFMKGRKTRGKTSQTEAISVLRAMTVEDEANKGAICRGTTTSKGPNIFEKFLQHFCESYSYPGRYTTFRKIKCTVDKTGGRQGFGRGRRPPSRFLENERHIQQIYLNYSRVRYLRSSFPVKGTLNRSKQIPCHL